MDICALSEGIDSDGLIAYRFYYLIKQDKICGTGMQHACMSSCRLDHRTSLRDNKGESILS